MATIPRMDLAERLEAIQAANSEPLPATRPYYTDAETKDVFLGALENGKTLHEAADLAYKPLRWFRKFRNTKSRVYDVDFTNAYEEIMAPGGPNQYGLGQRAVTNLAKASDDGNVRASEKLMAAYHADFGWLKTQAAQGTLNVATLIQILPGVSNETLERMIEEAEAQKALPKGVNQVIDAE